ncbi:MAG: HU family DNA-binding protein [Bacteroidia bacterium]|nr:HU family DNA-binding protein [Bacteroidia bacterium]
MEKYIQQLITDNTRVIIPDFGAFIRPQGEGEVMFNQFLSFDDGMLVEAVKTAENISEDEAKSRIAAYVESVKAKLNAGESISIEGIGEFHMEDNHIVMDNSAQKSPIIDMQPTEPQEAPKSSPEPTVVVNNYSEKSNYLWVYIVAIVCLFLIGVYVCLFVVNKDNAVYNYFYGTEQVDEEIVEPVVEPEPEVVPEPEPEPAPVVSLEKRYNIVVGTYNDEAAANARVEYLKSKGFKDAFATPRNIKGRTKFMAVIESHDKLPTAERRQEEIVDTYRIESWITNAGE